MGPRSASVALCLAVAGGTTAAASLVAPGAAQASVRPAIVQVMGPSPSSGAANPYRHGAVPPRGQGRPPQAAGRASTTANDLSFGGGIDNVGVTTGAPRVYLVFYGSQWGSQGTGSFDGQTYTTFSGDPSQMAPDLQAFFSGLGTGGELWSGVMTQYCEGVTAGSFTCPSNSSHVAYPTGGALAGVWEDTSVSSPSVATPAQLAQEAEKAAGHFGNTTTAANRDDQYFIVSPTGTHPDDFNTIFGNFCAWHDFTGDGSLGSVTQTNGVLAFTNMPYVTDMGASCGADFVNSGSAGALDGVTIVGGHEYAETITDQFPGGGWTDSSGNENGDKCAWITTGNPGAAANLPLTTGSFAVQSTWANDANGGSGGCDISHSIVTNGSANTVTVTNPGGQTGTVGTAVSLQIQASDSASGQTLTYSATGLPAGLSIGSSTGLISGTPTTATVAASVTVKAVDTTGASGSAAFTWTVNSAGGNTVTVTNPGNQTSAVGTAVSLQIHATDSQTGQTLTYSAQGLPAGLSINSSTGLISGTPTTPVSNASVKVTATDTTSAQGSASFTWTVNSAPNKITVTNPGNQSTRLSRSVSLQIHATDSASGQTLTYTATGLPRGLSINPSTGLISGTTTASGFFSVTVRVTDTTGASGSTSFNWSVSRR
jgi:hypothetical protein